MSEPTQQAVRKLQVRDGNVIVHDANCTTQGRCNSTGSGRAKLCHQRMVVHELLLWLWEFKQLREDGIQNHIFRFPQGIASRSLAEFIDRRVPLRKNVYRPVAVKIDEEFGSVLAVVLQLIHGIDYSISKQ